MVVVVLCVCEMWKVAKVNKANDLRQLELTLHSISVWYVNGGDIARVEGGK